MSHVSHGGEPVLTVPSYAGQSLPETVAEAERLVASIEQAVCRKPAVGSAISTWRSIATAFS